MQVYIVMLKNEIISVCGDEQTAKWEKEMLELDGNDDVVIKKYGVVSYDNNLRQRNLKAYISMQNSYKCDKKAAEWLEDDSICVLENNKIRRVKPGDSPDTNIYVHVDNIRKDTGREKYINEGDYVRYEILRK
ncbi:MAG: hypothetical protein ACI35O_04035 [Bacillaceae bacterium]